MTPPARRDEILRAFDEAAADYTALGHHLWEPIGMAAAAAAAPRPGDRVLDACCGAGASAIPTAGLVGTGGLVDAVDLSEAMIGELRRRADGLPQLRAHQSDVTAWTTGGYDIVQSVLGIFFFPDLATGTEHLIGLARPGGRVAFTIWRGDAMAAAGEHLGRAVAEVTEAAPPGDRPVLPIQLINQPDTYAAWLTDRGLSGVEVVTNELRLPATPDLAWLMVTGSGYRGALATLDAAAVESVRTHYLESLHRDGVTQFDSTTLIGTGVT